LYSKIIEEDCHYILSQTANLSWLQGKTLFVTGVNGLIASYLVETVAYANKINKKPITLFGIYRSESDRLSHIQDENIILTKHSDYSYHNINADYILHLACNSSPDYFTKHPIETIETNIISTKWLLEEASKCKATMLYFSSGEIAGHPAVIPTPENYPGNSLISDERGAYIESKRCAEALCYAYHNEKGVKFKIFRPFIVYGPGYKVTDTRVIPSFIRSALTKKEITMRTNGSETRSFVYLADALCQILRLLAIRHSDTFNVGSQLESTIACLAGHIKSILPDTKIYLGKEIPSGALRVCPDMNKTNKITNYTSAFTLDKGIERTIAYFKEVFNEKSTV